MLDSLPIPRPARVVRSAVLLAATLLACAAVPVRGQEPDLVRSGTRGQGGVGSVELGRYVFAGIGIDSYRDPMAWPELQNARNDVNGVRGVLVDWYEFEAPRELQLEDGRATKAAIMDTIIPALARTLQQTDNLVLFFAGHGHTHRTVAGGEVRRTDGYIIPHDGGADDPYSWIEIEGFLNLVAGLPARHILVILDSCHSGMALGGMKTRSGGTVSGAAAELASGFSRRVITSAQADQKALDQGPRERHSLFTGWLVEGLESALSEEGGQRSPDLDGDGIITTTELHTFVRGRVMGYEGSSQVPDFGAFRLDERGELIIALATDPFRQFYSEALHLFSDPDLLEPGGGELREVFLALADSALALGGAGPQEAYLRLRRGEVLEKDGDVLAALEALDRYHGEGQEIPIGINELRAHLRRMRQFCDKYSCDVTEPSKIEVGRTARSTRPDGPSAPRLFAGGAPGAGGGG